MNWLLGIGWSCQFGYWVLVVGCYTPNFAQSPQPLNQTGSPNQHSKPKMKRSQKRPFFLMQLLTVATRFDCPAIDVAWRRPSDFCNYLPGTSKNPQTYIQTGSPKPTPKTPKKKVARATSYNNAN
jgi:hypothetical protein